MGRREGREEGLWEGKKLMYMRDNRKGAELGMEMKTTDGLGWTWGGSILAEHAREGKAIPR